MVLGSGTAIFADLTTPFGKALYRYGFNAAEARIIAALLGPGDVFVDGGAHVGVFTLIAAAAVGETGRVVACEPVPETFQLLRQNVALNRFSWVDTRNVALADGSGREEIHSFGAGSGLSSFAPASRIGSHPVLVEVTTLDDLVQQCGLSSVRVVKLDLEGTEVRALRGARDLLQSRPDFLVEVEPQHLARQQTSVSELRSLFIDLGYQGYEIYGDRVNARLVPVDIWKPPAANPNMLVTTRSYSELSAMIHDHSSIQ